MGENKQKEKKEKPLPTIWKVPDELWQKVEAVLGEYDPPKATGRKRACPRHTFDAVIFRLRSGCQWNQLPKELGDDSTAHRTFQRWVEAGVFPRLWAVLLEACEELDGVNWEWQSADASMGKARLGGIKSAPTRPTEAKPGSSEAC